MASSSSVYGDLGVDGACREMDANGTGLKSYYAVTKWINEELTSRIVSPTTPVLCLRFFTVFGAWGRPDMAYYIFAQRMLDEEPLHVNGSLDVLRDFTFIDDVVAYVVDALNALLENPTRVLTLTQQPSGSHALNICNGRSVLLSQFVELLATALGKTPSFEVRPSSPLDARATHGDPRLLRQVVGNTHLTDLALGVESLASWAWDNRSNLKSWGT